MDPCSAPTRTVAVVVLGVLLAGSAASAATSISFRGKTSQKRAISFKLGGGAVTELQYRITDRCPDGTLLFVHNWGFPRLPVKNSRFGGSFVAKPPQQATAIVAGRVSGDTVSGTLSDRTRTTRPTSSAPGRRRSS